MFLKNWNESRKKKSSSSGGSRGRSYLEVNSLIERNICTRFLQSRIKTNRYLVSEDHFTSFVVKL